MTGAEGKNELISKAKCGGVAGEGQVERKVESARTDFAKLYDLI